MDRFGKDAAKKNKIMRDILMADMVNPWKPGMNVGNE